MTVREFQSTNCRKCRIMTCGTRLWGSDVNVTSIVRRVRRLETTCHVSDLSHMSDADLVAEMEAVRPQVVVMIAALGGQDAAVAALRAAGAGLQEIEFIEQWPESGGGAGL